MQNISTIYFINIVPSLADNINGPSDKSFNNFLSNTIHSKFEFKHVQTKDIEEIIDNLPPKSSSGPYDISLKLLKNMKESLVIPIKVIINQMSNTGLFPNKLKIAKVLPLYKKGEKHILGNYRPISLLPLISKSF